MLLEKGADINKTGGDDGDTPLMLASSILSDNTFDVMQLLLDNGADIDSANKHGWTALHYACNKGDVDAVRLLLDNGAEINPVTKQGETPQFLAAEREHSAVVNLLKNRLSDPVSAAQPSNKGLLLPYPDQG